VKNGSAPIPGPTGGPPATQVGRDARHHTRVGPALPVHLHLPGRAALDGVIRDLSFGGMFVEVAASGIVLCECRVEIPLGDRQTRIGCKAKIVRIAPFGVALHIESISDLVSYTHLLNLIRYNSHDVEQIEREINSRGE
jgi:hypothetical protein